MTSEFNLNEERLDGQLVGLPVDQQTMGVAEAAPPLATIARA